MQFAELLSEMGINEAETLERFGGIQMLLEKMLKNFLDDQNFAGLKEEVEQGDAEAAEHAAHTLKGMCGNLGMAELSRLNADFVDRLRGGDASGMKEDLAGIAREYERIVGLLKSYYKV